MKRNVVVILIVLVVACIAVGLTWRWTHSAAARGELALYGNVDLRQAELAFNNSERITSVIVQEGDHVHRGQVLATLDTRRLLPQVEQAKAAAEAQRQVVARLRNGNRPEEIAQAKANVESAKADAANVKLQYERLADLARNSAGRAVSHQDLDNAKAALDVANARLMVSDKTLELQLAGPRKEDIAQAEAMLHADEAQLQFLQQQLTDAQLIAPADGVIRSRLMEPGEMASPQKPVFSLAVVDPKWVRAYVSEPDLGKVRPGFSASVEVDGFPGHRFEGWIGFISPVAEFTPKTVQTQELRSSLVYEIRVFVRDPGDNLRLGMPATVFVGSAQSKTTGPATQPSSDDPSAR